MIETTCHFCNLRIRVPAKIYPPFICACGKHLPIPDGVEVVDTAVEQPQEQRPFCAHLGNHIGVLECRCGLIYQCDLLNKMCSNKAPFDIAVMAVIGDDHIWLTKDNYQACEACESFAAPAPQVPLCQIRTDG